MALVEPSLAMIDGGVEFRLRPKDDSVGETLAAMRFAARGPYFARAFPDVVDASRSFASFCDHIEEMV
jgi:hypothetical protein